MHDRIISHYEVLDKIGNGGMGVVYKAKDTQLERPAALKFLAPGLLEERDALERFGREARAIASLNHPNIATLYEILDDDGSPVMAFEYLPGGTLRSLITKRRLSAAEIILLGAQMADGLDCAHRHGLIHLDVKPENMLFTEDGWLKITDFGLARINDGRTVTVNERIAGTLHYFSPECVRGLVPDHRADIFSLGIVLYEMAAGMIPFQNESAAAVLYHIANDSTPPLKPLCPDLPEAMERIIRRATCRDRQLRYQSMAELACDLRQCQQSTGPPVAEPSAVRKILVIEDNDSLREVLALGLSEQGYSVVAAGSGREGVRLAVEEQPHLVLLDVGLPGQNGLDVCRELRQKGFLVPIIMVTGKTEEIDRVLGLEIGADDYVTKPFSRRELLARIRAQLRRCA